MSRRRQRRRWLPYLLLLLVLALGSGFLLNESMGILDESVQDVDEDLDRTKRALLATADLDRVHHEVFGGVGPLRWDDDVRPAVLSELTRRTAIERGTLLPSAGDVIDWVRDHPSEAREILNQYRR